MAKTASKTRAAKKTEVAATTGTPGDQPAGKVVLRKAAAVIATPPAVVEAGGSPAATGTPVLRLKDLLERVMQRSGARKAAARPVVDAVLAELGDALSRGESFTLPPLGKAKVSRSKSGGGAEVIVVKLRRATGKKEPLSPLAPDED